MDNGEFNLDILENVISDENVIDSIADLTDEKVEIVKPKKEDEVPANKEVKSDETPDPGIVDSLYTIEKAGDSNDQEVYSVFAELLKQKGFIDYEEGEVVDEDFISVKVNEKFNNELQASIDAAKAELDERTRRINDLYEEGYDLNDVVAFEKKLDYYKALEVKKELTEHEAEKIVKTLLKNQGLDDEDIADEIEVLKIDEKLEARALKAIPTLKRIEEKSYNEYKVNKDKADKQAIEQYNKRVKDTQNYFESQEKILGVELTKKERTELFNFYANTGKQGITALEEYRSKDPLKFDTTVAFLAKNNFDLSKIKQVVKNETIADIQNKIKTKPDSKIAKLDINKIRKSLNS